MILGYKLAKSAWEKRRADRGEEPQTGEERPPTSGSGSSGSTVASPVSSRVPAVEKNEGYPEGMLRSAGSPVDSKRSASFSPVVNVPTRRTTASALSPTETQTPGSGSRSPEESIAPHAVRRDTAHTSGARSAGPFSSFDLNKGVHQKKFRHIPFLQWPQPLGPEDDESSEWLTEETEGTEWLVLFYDLVVVAVLSVFSQNTELSAPGNISIFFSYYVILSWMWSSQTAYDMRYQAEDGWHRQMKALQIGVFVYIGAASGNWNLAKIQNPDTIPDVSIANRSVYAAGGESFTTVLISYAISRGILLVQYLVVAYMAKKTNRPRRGHFACIITLAISIVLCIIAITVPAHSARAVIAKITLFYLGIGIEVIAGWAQLARKLHVKVAASKIAERYGALTLIILGEGFIGLIRAFNNAISGLSAGSSTTYLQVFLAVGIIYYLWAFLFSHFRRADKVASRRAYLWESIHFPLLFALLLLFGAIVNVIVVLSYAQGIRTVSNEFTETLYAIHNGTSLSEEQQYSIAVYLNKLNLEPPFPEEYAYLHELSTSPDPSDDATILALQYYGLILFDATTSYGIEVEEELLTALENLYSVNSTNPHNATLSLARQANATEFVGELLTIPTDRALSGILWLFPCAGATLMLISIRGVLWYRFQGIAHWIIYGSQFIFGLALALLGLLDIGGHNVDVETEEYDTDHVLVGLAPTYRLLDHQLPLVVVHVVYFIVFSGTVFVLSRLHRLRGDVWEERTGRENFERVKREPGEVERGREE